MNITQSMTHPRTTTLRGEEEVRVEKTYSNTGYGGQTFNRADPQFAAEEALQCVNRTARYRADDTAKPRRRRTGACWEFGIQTKRDLRHRPSKVGSCPSCGDDLRPKNRPRCAYLGTSLAKPDELLPKTVLRDEKAVFFSLFCLFCR